jgi:hypothetical protein
MKRWDEGEEWKRKTSSKKEFAAAPSIQAAIPAGW